MTDQQLNDVSTPPVAISAAHDVHGADESPRDQISSDNGSSDPTYSQPVLPKSSSLVCAPPATERLVYDDIQGYQNKEVINTSCHGSA